MASSFDNQPRGKERRYPNGERMRDEDFPGLNEEVPEAEQTASANAEDEPHKRCDGRFAPAMVLVAVGAIFLLANMGLLSFHDIWRYWPLILIAIGVARLTSRTPEERTSAIVTLMVGAVFLVANLGLLHVNFGMLWPLILIGVGLLMFTRGWDGGGRRGYRNAKHEIKRRIRQDVTDRIDDAMNQNWGRHSEHFDGGASSANSYYTDADSTLDNWALFGGVNRVIMSQNFKGGQLLAIFGGIEIDLRRAQIADVTKPVVIYANAAFGGVTIKVPDAWRIAVRGVGIFGGYQDESIKVRHPEVNAPLLIVSGYAAFGGVVIE